MRWVATGPVYNPARRAAEGVRALRGVRGRWIVAIALVAVLVGAVVATVVAERYADGPGGAEVGYARLDRGIEFVYHAVRLSRDARLGASDAAEARARSIWAGPPAVASGVQLVYQDGPFAVPVPPGGTQPATDNRVAEPLSRFGWVVEGRVRRGPVQMIGLLDYTTGQVAWSIRPLPPVTP